MSEPLFRSSLPPPGGERPLRLTVLCAVGALAASSALALGLTGDLAQAVGPLFWPYLLASAGGTLLAVAGLWRLRRWGVGVYAATALVDNAVLALTGDWRWFTLAIPLFVLGVCGSVWRRLR